jgi:hypothetical protein
VLALLLEQFVDCGPKCGDHCLPLCRQCHSNSLIDVGVTNRRRVEPVPAVLASPLGGKASLLLF